MQIIISLELAEETNWEQVQKAIASAMPAATKLDVVPSLNLIDSYGAKGIMSVVDEAAAVNYLSHKNTW